MFSQSLKTYMQILWHSHFHVQNLEAKCTNIEVCVESKNFYVHASKILLKGYENRMKI